MSLESPLNPTQRKRTNYNDVIVMSLVRSHDSDRFFHMYHDCFKNRLKSLLKIIASVLFR